MNTLKRDVTERLKDLEAGMKEWECPCCFRTPMIVEDMQQCQNAHVICSGCLQKLAIESDGNSKCPLCRVAIDRRPDRKIRVNYFSSQLTKYHDDLSTVSAMCEEEQVFTEFICMGCSKIIPQAVIEFDNGNPKGSWLEAQKHIMECEMFAKKCKSCTDDLQMASYGYYVTGYVTGFRLTYPKGWQYAVSGMYMPHDHNIHCTDTVFKHFSSGYAVETNQGYVSGFQDAKSVISARSFTVTDGLILYRWQVRCPGGLWSTPDMNYQDAVSRLFRNSSHPIISTGDFTIDFINLTQTGPSGIQVIRLLRTVRSQDLPSHRYPGGSHRISADNLVWQFEVRHYVHKLYLFKFCFIAGPRDKQRWKH